MAKTIANTRRFFVDPAELSGDALQINDPDLAHQLGRVLRLGAGDRVLLLDGRGTACTVELSGVSKSAVSGHVIERSAAGGEPAVAIDLYLALIRPERFEWAVQKSVELGVRRIVPVHCARSLPADRADPRKIERWNRIAREAAEQSCSGIVPEIAAPINFAAALAATIGANVRLILWEGEAPSLPSVLADANLGRGGHIALLSGPEGGISQEELTAASEHGMIPVSLGARILRAETAPVAAIAALLYALDWGA